jgi:hypothetical protein
MFLGFENLSNWKDFERLCTYVLATKEFSIESEPFVDRAGIDFLAVEEFRSYDRGDIIRIRWRV